MKDRLKQNTLNNLSGAQSLTPENRETIATLWAALGEAGYPDERIGQLLQAADSPGDATLLLQMLRGLANAGTGWQALSGLIDESCYSLSDWARAIVRFLNSEVNRSSAIKPTSMIAYLGCCAEAATSNLILLPFEEQLEEMLETFGYEGND